MTRLDFQGDVGHRQFHKIAKLYELPDYVLGADPDQVTSPGRAAHLHADVRLPYQFPCHNKAATLLSAAYFLENQDQLPAKVRPVIRDHLNKFAAYFGIAGDLKALEAKHAEITKEAEYPDSDYAIVEVSESGTKDRFFPMRNRMETKAAADWFAENLPGLRTEYDFRTRQMIAEKILDKCSEYVITLPNEQTVLLERHAGLGTGSPIKVAQHIRNRARFATEPEIKLALASAADIAENKPSAFLDPAILSEIAQTIDQFDRQSGLLNKYATALPAPEDFLFEVTQTKIAELADTCFMTPTGNTYTREQLTKLSTGKIRSLLGDDIANAVSSGMRLDPIKLADVAITLPLGDAQLFDELMSSVGEQPIEKASYHLGLSPEVLSAIAAV